MNNVKVAIILILIILTLFLTSCFPCYQKVGVIFIKNITIVYENYECSTQVTCSKLKVYKLARNLSQQVDTICVENKNKDLFPTDCYVTLKVSEQDIRENPLLIEIENTNVSDTIYEVIIEDPCDNGQIFLRRSRAGGKILTNINGKWYEGEIIYK